MLKIAICDDDIICREQVHNLVKIYIAEENQNITVTTYEHGDDLLDDAIRIGGYDIYILDVMMPDTSGIELGLSLRDAGLDGKIIYLTSSEEYAIDAFRAKASNYILKPATKATLFPILTEVIQWISSRVQHSVLVRTKEGSVKLAYNNILYIELVGRSLVYHLINGQTVESITLRTSFSDAIQELLQDNRFSLCGASLLVNLHHIVMVKTEEVVFKNNVCLFISKRLAKELRSVWSEFWLNETEKQE